ncbi:MAG: ROK family protein [Chloroflexi bacterium]|nr:ROK family protein [Chloroflexota bacterium]
MIEDRKGKFVVAIDLGGTNLRVAAVTFDGQILRRASTPTRAAEGVASVINRMVRKAFEVIGADHLKQAAGLVVAAPGPTDPWTGTIINPPNLPGWVNVPLKKELEARLGLSTFVANDANAAALGEYHFGAGRGTRHMIYVTVSTGIGGGIIVDGKLLLGKNGGAGEVGHMTIDMDGPRCACGNVGCLEAMASGTAIARQASERLRAGVKSSILDEVGGDLSLVTGMVVVQEAEKGDRLATEIITTAATAVGVGMVNLVNLFDPEVIAIGGGISNAGPLLFDPVRQIVNERAMGIAKEGLRIVPTVLGDDVGLLGAVPVAIAALNGG